MSNVLRSCVFAIGSATTLLGCGSFEEYPAGDVAIAEQGLSKVDHSVRDSKRCAPLNHQRFAVFSDPHFYDTALGSTGMAFEKYMATDRKTLLQSEAILREVVERILEVHPDFVLVPGDLTKDGEWINHVKFARYLRQIERAGIDVFVVPGNHDIMNPDAVRYEGDSEEPVRNVTEDEFARIYREFGYGEAIDRDPNSLSYLVEPTKGVWLLGIDSTRHRENTAENGPVTAGRLSSNTLDWVLDKLAKAKRHGKRVIGMMHHGLVEHYAGETMLFPEYVIENYATVSQQLASAGLSIVFTGHFHANDVTEVYFDNGSKLVDVETGSLLTAPSPYRFVDYYPREQKMVVSTEQVTALPDMPDFGTWSSQFLDSGLKDIITYQLTTSKLADAATAQRIAPVVAAALEEHYAGDESPPDEMTRQIATMLSASGSAAGQAWGYSLISLHTDRAPADNDVVLSLGGTNNVAR